jgi:site-specific DNA-adenine methylase
VRVPEQGLPARPADAGLMTPTRPLRRSQAETSALTGKEHAMPTKNKNSTRRTESKSNRTQTGRTQAEDKKKPTRFLPSYVGSKAHWVKELVQFKGRDFVEFFAGSAVISANLANRAVLNDSDPFLYRYFREYERQPLVETFTDRDFFARRSQGDWYKYLYYLQKMCFSGVYRWSKNGYNVSIKPEYKSKPVHLKDDVERSIERFKALNPSLHNLDYLKVPIPEKPDVAVLDPPYESKQAAYCSASFDYERYWDFVHECMDVFRVVIIFDCVMNMRAHGFRNYDTRKMRVNGKHKGSLEAMCIIDNERP